MVKQEGKRMLRMALVWGILGVLSVTVLGADQRFLLEEQRTAVSPATIEYAIDVGKIGDGRQVRLGLDCRIDGPMGGSNPWINVAINGTYLKRHDLVNKPAEVTTRNGMDMTWVKGIAWRICTSPDFSDELRTAPIAMAIADVDPFRFVWDITPYVQAESSNAIKINVLPIFAEGSTCAFRNIVVEIGSPVTSAAAAPVTPAPTGEVPTYICGQPKLPPEMAVSLTEGGQLRVTVGEREFAFGCRTSAPGGQWVVAQGGSERRIEKTGQHLTASWQGAGYEVSRKVLLRDDHVEVADTITNVCDQLIGVIYENWLAWTTKPQNVFLAGQKAYAPVMQHMDCRHPTVLGVWSDMAVGMAAEDDVFRVHSRQFVEEDRMGLSDGKLGIEPGQSYMLEWSIYPVARGDYWDFLNALRRNWGVNDTTVYGMTFETFTADADSGQKEVEFYREWMKTRGVQWILSTQQVYTPDERKKYGGVYNNMLAEGTAIPLAKGWCDSRKNLVEKLKAADSEMRYVSYLFTECSTEPNAETIYADSRWMGAGGKHVTTPYSYPIYLYLTLLDNTYGQALMEMIRWYVPELKLDGFFLDGIEPMGFGEGGGVESQEIGWDGYSVLIDPATHAVKGKTTSTVLLLQPFKVALHNYLKSRGGVIVGNGAPNTRTMQKVGVRLVEVNSYSFLIHNHLSTPVGLGQMDTGKAGYGSWAEMTRRMLDQGGLHMIYHWLAEPPSGVNFYQVMYPITPQQLGAGMVLGKERIVTNRSGRYGWSDNSKAKVYVFDADGVPVEDPQVKEVHENGQVLTEVRMPSDHFAVLARVLGES